jgi:hypothetical protein
MIKMMKALVLLAILSVIAASALTAKVVANASADCPGSGQTCKVLLDGTVYVKGLDQEGPAHQ